MSFLTLVVSSTLTYNSSAKLKRTEAAVQAYRGQIDTHKAERYGFASLAAVPYAHIVAQKLRGKHPKGTDIVLAPNPRDIVSIIPITRPQNNLISPPDLEEHEQN